MLNFKTPRQHADWIILIQKNPNLTLAAAATHAVISAIGRTPRISCVHRNEEENKAAGGRTDTHSEWRAVDVGAEEWSMAWARGTQNEKNNAWAEASKAADFVNAVFTTGVAFVGGAEMLVANGKQHGTAPHVHVQDARPTDISTRHV